MMPYAVQVDARSIEPKDKQPTIFGTFQNLLPGQTMELVNDHDPSPLKYKFEAELAGQFDWEYREKGPEVWRVVITKKGVQ